MHIGSSRANAHAEPWALQDLDITLRGVTSSSRDPGVDVWRNVSFPLLRGLAGAEALSALSLKVLKRGSGPQVRSPSGAAG